MDRRERGDDWILKTTGRPESNTIIGRAVYWYQYFIYIKVVNIIPEYIFMLVFNINTYFLAMYET